MKKIITLSVMIMFMAGSGCNKDKVANDPPEIATAADDFPLSCSEVRRGEAFTFTATFKDNKALGSYSLDIHNNFDHHNHDTEIDDCGLDPVKDPIDPFLFINTYDIPTGKKEYKAAQPISIPADIDPGDYHFMIKVTNAAGWQTLKGLSIKILP